MRRFRATLHLSLLSAALFAASAGCEDTRSFFNRTTLEQDLRAMRDPVFPDERRIGIANLQRRDELFQETYKAELRTLAAKDPAPIVRAQATRALNQARDTEARPIFLDLLKDPEAPVRLEAVKALRNQPDERAIPQLLALASSPEQNRDVRIWAVTALGAYRRIDVARAVVPLVSTRDFSVAFEARSSLRRMTGRDYYYDEGQWLRYLASRPDPFRPPPPAVAPARPVEKPFTWRDLWPF